MSLVRIQSPIFREQISAGTPAHEGELHRVSMAGKGERVVLTDDFFLPVQRVMSEEYAEHAVCTCCGLWEVTFRRKVS